MRDCLWLVNENRETKDIARRLNLSPGRVDKLLTQSLAVTGISRRSDLARMFVAYERSVPAPSGIAQSLGGQSLGLSESPNLAPNVAADEEPADAPGNEEELRGPDNEPISMPARQMLFPVPFETARRRRNDLSLTSRTLMVLLIAMVCAAAFGAVGSLLLTFNRLVAEMHHSRF